MQQQEWEIKLSANEHHIPDTSAICRDSWLQSRGRDLTTASRELHATTRKIRFVTSFLDKLKTKKRHDTICLKESYQIQDSGVRYYICWIFLWCHMVSKKVQWQHCQASTPVDTTWPQRKRTTKEHLERRSGDVDSRIQAEGWRKMEVAAQNKAGDGKEWSMAYVLATESDKAQVKSHVISESGTCAGPVHADWTWWMLVTFSAAAVPLINNI